MGVKCGGEKSGFPVDVSSISCSCCTTGEYGKDCVPLLFGARYGNGEADTFVSGCI